MVKYRIAKDVNHQDEDVSSARGLTWSSDKIDKAYASYKRFYPDCVIVKIKLPWAKL